MPPFPGRRRRKGPYNSNVTLGSPAQTRSPGPYNSDVTIGPVTDGAGNVVPGRTYAVPTPTGAGRRAGQQRAANRAAAEAARRAAAQRAAGSAVTLGPDEPVYDDPADPAAAGGSTYYVSPADYTGPKGISVGGVAPNVPSGYDAWLRTQPEYQRAVAARDTARASQMGDLSTAIANAIGRFGGARVQRASGIGPNGATYMGADIDAIRDAVTAALAKTDAGKALLGSLDWSQIQSMADNATAGGVSTYDRLVQENDEMQRQIANSALARGVYGSGLMGNDRLEQNKAYTQSQYGAQNELLDYLTGLTSAFAQGETDRQGSFEAAIGGIPVPEWAGAGGNQGPVGAGEATAPPPTPDGSGSGSGGGGGGGGAARAKQKRASASAAAARARARARARRAK